MQIAPRRGGMPSMGCERSYTSNSTSISPDERDSLVDSLPYSAVNTRRRSLQDAFAYKCDDWLLDWLLDWLFALLQLAPVYSQVRIRRKKRPNLLRDDIHLVTDLLKGRWGRTP